MSDATANRFAKLLAVVGGLGLFGFVLALSTGDHACDYAASAAFRCDGYAAADLLFGIVSLGVGLTGILMAISTRRRMGEPIVGPWKGWS